MLDNWLNSFEFDANTANYSAKNAFALGKFSMLAYSDRDAVREIVRQWGFKHFRFFDLGVTQAFLVADDEKIIVAFRGTNDLKDWLGNLDIDLVGGPFGGRVHEGFSNALSLVWKEMQLTINALKPRHDEATVAQTSMTQTRITRVPSLWFTGHSLGAALATLAVARLREKDQPVHGLYTFGSPRMGDRTFERFFNADFRSKTFRFVNKNDVVTRVPLRALFYSHVGQLCYFDENDVMHTDSSFWYRFLDGIKVRMEDIADLDLSTVESHEMTGYVRALEKNLGAAVGDRVLTRV